MKKIIITAISEAGNNGVKYLYETRKNATAIEKYKFNLLVKLRLLSDDPYSFELKMKFPDNQYVNYDLYPSRIREWLTSLKCLEDVDYIIEVK